MIWQIVKKYLKKKDYGFMKTKKLMKLIEQIENGDTPDGYTWHHDAEAGKMQLVDTETHQKTGHTGGRSIWGGGTESR